VTIPFGGRKERAMDFYANSRMMEAESKRRIAELRSMATDSSIHSQREESEEQRSARYYQWFADRLAALAAQRRTLGQT
jgi:hypothetical protein